MPLSLPAYNFKIPTCIEATAQVTTTGWMRDAGCRTGSGDGLPDRQAAIFFRRFLRPWVHARATFAGLPARWQRQPCSLLDAKLFRTARTLIPFDLSLLIAQAAEAAADPARVRQGLLVSCPPSSARSFSISF